MYKDGDTGDANDWEMHQIVPCAIFIMSRNLGSYQNEYRSRTLGC